MAAVDRAVFFAEDALGLVVFLRVVFFLVTGALISSDAGFSASSLAMTIPSDVGESFAV